MANPRFLEHAPFSHRSAYGSYEEGAIKLPKNHNWAWATGMIAVLVAVMGLIFYYVL